MPRFSVIIPTHNRASILPVAIRSVKAQRFEDWELIIVDDGSTDDTAAVVRTFLDDSRIRYHWQENKELNGARNTGVALAKGEFICFLDDDDLYLANHLSTLATLIATYQQETAFYRTGLIIKSSSKTWQSKLYNAQEDDLLTFVWTENLGITSFAFPREIFQQHRFAEQYVLADDLHFLMRVAINYELIQAKGFTVIYHKHDTARTATYYQPEQLANKLACLEEILNIDAPSLEVIKTPKARQQLYAQEYLYFARAAFRKGDILGWRYFRQSFSFFQLSLLKAYLSTLYQGLRNR